MTHYETLGVPPATTQAGIKAAYRKASSAAHPDKEGGSHEKQQAVNKAYEVLGDPERRAHYDQHGEEEIRSLADEAQASLVEMFAAILQGPAENLMAEAKSRIVQAIQNLSMQAGQHRGEIKRLERKRGKLRRKDGGPSLMDALIKDRIEIATANVARLERGLQVAAGMQKLLDEYEGDPPPAMPVIRPQMFYNSNIGAFFTTGGDT